MWLLRIKKLTRDIGRDAGLGFLSSFTSVCWHFLLPAGRLGFIRIGWQLSFLNILSRRLLFICQRSVAGAKGMDTRGEERGILRKFLLDYVRAAGAGLLIVDLSPWFPARLGPFLAYKRFFSRR